MSLCLEPTTSFSHWWAPAVLVWGLLLSWIWLLGCMTHLPSTLTEHSVHTMNCKPCMVASPLFEVVSSFTFLLNTMCLGTWHSSDTRIRLFGGNSFVKLPLCQVVWFDFDFPLEVATITTGYPASVTWSWHLLMSLLFSKDGHGIVNVHSGLTSAHYVNEGKGEQVFISILISSVQSFDQLGRRGDLRDNSAEILCQSFLQKAHVKGSGMGTDVHSLMLSIQHFYSLPITALPTLQGALKLALEKLS